MSVFLGSSSPLGGLGGGGEAIVASGYSLRGSGSAGEDWAVLRCVGEGLLSALGSSSCLLLGCVSRFDLTC